MKSAKSPSKAVSTSNPSERASKHQPDSHTTGGLDDFLTRFGDINTTQERCAEIASMDQFGLREFIELTSVAVGPYGIYDVTNEGVTLRAAADSLQGLLPSEQILVMDAEEKLSSLTFPCSAVQFKEWYDTTRGLNGISDFPLALDFFDTYAKPKNPLGDPVMASKIVAAFSVHPDPAKNKQWWDVRMRGACVYDSGPRFAHGSPLTVVFDEGRKVECPLLGRFQTYDRRRHRPEPHRQARIKSD